MYLFVIKQLIEVNRSVVLVAITLTPGFKDDKVLDVIAQPYPNKILVIINDTFILLNFYNFPIIFIINHKIL